MIKILIHLDEVIGYTHDKKILKSFIKDYGLEDYRIEKVKKIPDDIEYEYQNKEIYYDHHYDTCVTEEILEKISVICEEICSIFIPIHNNLEDYPEYIKFTPEEENDVYELRMYLEGLIEELIGLDGISGPNAFYSDFFDVKQLIKEYLHKNITIYGGE